MPAVVRITKKGQATIPKRLRKKFGFGDRALVIERGDGVLFKPIAQISEEKGSLREIFKDKTADQILKDARDEDARKEKRLESIT
ncbi:AbrB/MazE/SpoVT family DNA-binding domain-containing protein [ANME-2 cluster archaeon]|nr:AbrB/MazE/SpoVT family DNA-binding domain-containing protein [Methanosarcinales archaeon]RJS73506.1 MAG: AbrB/MazE/SpoVT family DNA-binding domain-containing protein [ANME-2 cluster archaeon]RLG22135.1 MAG: AbrB/MazE/SpoVT family DNA-binding domain-containing protein [Methanosarcinales archaeon]